VVNDNKPIIAIAHFVTHLKRAKGHTGLTLINPQIKLSDIYTRQGNCLEKLVPLLPGKSHDGMILLRRGNDLRKRIKVGAMQRGEATPPVKG
jgi:hypothetical protein